MIISQIKCGIGNQLFQYAAGRRLAHKFNTEFKLDITWFVNAGETMQYALNQFNITAKIATPEEIQSLIKLQENCAILQQEANQIYNIWNSWDDTYLQGFWENERYFADIADIIRKEITLKNPLSAEAEYWKNKILSAECPVSLHFRHGDFLYDSAIIGNLSYAPLPFDYYCECINRLKQWYKNITLFVFSNNLPFVKENLCLDVPTEFVECHEDNNAQYVISSSRDIEELHLMSLCKHNIMANSTFSFWGVWLNQNPDKKVFIPMPLERMNNKSTYRGFLGERKANSSIDSDKWIRVPFDPNNRLKVIMRPLFSLLLLVNDDADTISETLQSIFGQDYDYYEVIIIDNASADGSDKICQQAIAGKENVTFKKLYTKVKNAEAWNMALDMAQGYWISFLKGNDRFSANFLSNLYPVIKIKHCDVIHFLSWFAENENGNVIVGDKKYSEQRDTRFMATKNLTISTDGRDMAQLLLNRQINDFLGTKIYNRDFLSKSKIKFDKNLEETELYFELECFFKSNCLMYYPKAFYIMPISKPTVANKAIEPAPRAVSTKDNLQIKSDRDLIARVDIKLTTNNGGGDFQNLSIFDDSVDVKLMTMNQDLQILFLSDDRALVHKPRWFQKEGVGYVIHSYAKKLEFIAKAVVDGEITLFLRGRHVIDPKDRSKLIPYWIDYTKLTVNGKVIFDKLTPVWHNRPYTYNMNVKTNEEVKIQAEWLPHKSDVIDKVELSAPKTSKVDKLATPAPTSSFVNKVDVHKIDEFRRYFTARVDVQLRSKTAGSDFQILNVSDNKASVGKPGWFQKDGIGYQIQSHVGNLEFVAKATIAAPIRLILRGIDVRDPKDRSKNIPYWIDYTKLTVNGKIIFDKLTPVWHNRPYTYSMEVKAGEEVKIQLEWLPHRSDT